MVYSGFNVVLKVLLWFYNSFIAVSWVLGWLFCSSHPADTQGVVSTSVCVF